MKDQLEAIHPHGFHARKVERVQLLSSDAREVEL